METIYQFTLEGDFIFRGNYEDSIDFIKKNKINKKKNKKEYEVSYRNKNKDSQILYRSDEFGFLFE